jgi:hypothetical protein
MQRQKLQPRIWKSDFATLGFIPDVPDDPIGIFLDRKLLCNIDGEFAIGGQLVIQRKLESTGLSRWDKYGSGGIRNDVGETA